MPPQIWCEKTRSWVEILTTRSDWSWNKTGELINYGKNIFSMETYNAFHFYIAFHGSQVVRSKWWIIFGCLWASIRKQALNVVKSQRASLKTELFFTPTDWQLNSFRITLWNWTTFRALYETRMHAYNCDTLTRFDFFYRIFLQEHFWESCNTEHYVNEEP